MARALTPRRGGSKMTAMAPRPLPWTRKLWLGLLVAGLVFAATEGALRLSMGPPPAAIQVHSGLDLDTPRFGERDGWRWTQYQPDPIPAWTVEPQGPRVGFLGESSVHGGSWLPLSAEFPALVGQLLGVEALNLGNPAVDSHDVVELVEQITAWRWSALVVYLGHNDYGNAWFQERYGDTTSALGARALGLASRLRLFHGLQRLIRGVDGTGHNDSRQEIRSPGDAQHRALSPARQLAITADLRANLRRVVWLCQRAHVPLVLVVPSVGLQHGSAETECSTDPCSRQVYSEAMALEPTDPAGARARYLQAWALDTIPLRITPDGMDAVREVATEAAGDGVWAVDAFRQLPQDPNLGLPLHALHNDSVHFSAQGHIAMAQLLAPVVQDAIWGGRR